MLCCVRVSLGDSVDCMPQRSNSLKLATIPTCSEVPGDATVFTLRPLRGSRILEGRGYVLGRASDVFGAVTPGGHSWNYLLGWLVPSFVAYF